MIEPASGRSSGEGAGITPAELAVLAADLKAAAADLTSYIDRRAAELAAPHIQAAETAAQRRVNELQTRLRQADAIITELRLQLDIQARLHVELLAEKRARAAHTTTS